MAVKSNDKRISAKSRLYGFFRNNSYRRGGDSRGCCFCRSLNVQEFYMVVSAYYLLPAAGVGIYFILRKTFYEYVYTFSRDHFLDSSDCG